ncbi:MAG: carbohydrate-binding family 9-like protein [Planctomycetota bacterium]
MRIPSPSRLLPAALIASGLFLPACSSAPDHPVLDLAGDIPRTYAAKYTHDAPTIDGKLDDRAWMHIPWTANFVELEGSGTTRPRYQSRAKMMWDRHYLYVGVWMIEPNLESKPVSSLGDDGLLAFITRDAERIDYQMVSIEPGGRLLENHFRSEVQASLKNHPSRIQGAVALSGTLNTPGDADRGWWAEIAIPWTAVELPKFSTTPETGSTIRVNLARQEGAWSPHYQHDLHTPRMWGKVQLVK